MKKTISIWSSFFLMDSNGPIMEFLMFFHDLLMILIFILLMNLISMFIFLMNMKNFSLSLEENQKMEDFFLLIPMIFLIFIGFPSIKNLYMCEEMNECDMTIKVSGHQWYWSYDILNFNLKFDSILNKESNFFRLLETFNHLIIPIKCSIRFLISSEDVIHSWTIPSLGVKMDATPGRISQISLLVNRSGIMVGQCSEICGSNHSFMPIFISANSMNNFMNYYNKYFF